MVGEAADCKAYNDMIGLPKRAPYSMLAAKRDDADPLLADLASRKVGAVVPGRSNGRFKIDQERTLYEQRNCIEQMF